MKNILRLSIFLILLLSWGAVNGCSKADPSQFAVLASQDDTVAHAFQNGISDLVVEIKGEVIRLLPDDLKGSRHQRFIIRLLSGQTLLISHNIDLAQRIDDLQVGDHVELRGEYEWNNKGGVVHWTHHDPQFRRPGGWIKHQNEVYR